MYVVYGIFPAGNLLTLYAFATMYLIAILGFGLLVKRINPTTKKGVSLPKINCHFLIGVTFICSIVPISFSLTTLSAERIGNVAKIGVESTHWYNPYMQYTRYIVPGILAILLTIIGGFLMR